MHNIGLHNSKIDQKDLDKFKIFTMIFAFSKVGALLATFISPLLETIINYAGTVFLVIGIFILAKNYPQLSSGMKVAGLFLLGILINVFSAIINYLYPIPQINTQEPSQNIQSVADSFYSHSPYIFGILVLGGLITVITAYYFTKWFNDNYTPTNQTKSYFYFGIVYSIGSIMSGLGVLIFAHSLNSIDLFTIKTDPHALDPALPGLTIFVIGSVLVLIAVFIQIIAGFKIYNRANNKAMGKLPFSVIQQTANMQPLQNSFQKTIIPNLNLSNSGKTNKNFDQTDSDSDDSRNTNNS